MEINVSQRRAMKRAISLLLFFTICVLTAGAQGQQKIYDDLFSASFPNEKEGWASGRWGCMLHTGDGGKTWTRQNTGTDLTLSSVFFVDPKNGWAVGEEGLIIHTADGGKTWEKQAGSFGISEKTGDLEGGNFLFDVVAIDPRTALAVGVDSYVIKTLDAGKTWQEIPTGAPKTQLFSIGYDPQKGMIVIGGNGLLLVSMDRGKTWKTAETDPPVIYDWIYGVARREEGSFLLVGGSGMMYLNEGKNPSASWKRIKY